MPAGLAESARALRMDGHGSHRQPLLFLPSSVVLIVLLLVLDTLIALSFALLLYDVLSICGRPHLVSTRRYSNCPGITHRSIIISLAGRAVRSSSESYLFL